MTRPVVHCGMSYLLFSVGALMIGLSLFIKIEFYKDWKNNHNVMESLSSGGVVPISSEGLKEGTDVLGDTAKKMDTIFWFFTVGAIILFSRAVVFAVCALKSEAKCLKGIRMEVIESLGDVIENKTEAAEVSEPTA